jgi:CheY-like chemotaxis protein
MSPHETHPLMGGGEPAENVSALDALEGLPLSGVQGLAGIRLAPVVAATLRAAVELVLGEEPQRRPVAAAGDDGALELTVAEARLESILAAGSLLETIEGNLSPAAGSAYRIRVPVVSGRSLYLMLEQGTLRLAVPWHSVIRIRLVRGETVEELARREGCVALDPWVTVPRKPGERPAVLVGLGVRHAFLGADRLVWRMPGEPVEPSGPPPGSSLGRAVRTAEGEVFWVVDATRLLRDVEPPRVPSAPARPTPAVLRPTPPKPPAPPRGTVTAMPRLVELRREDVEPLEPARHVEPPAPSPVVAPADPGPGEPTATLSPAAPAPAPAATRRALVAEDSIVGRIFLQRLLEPLGFTVEAVASARALEHALSQESWDVLFVDVELPDSPHAAHLRVADAGGRAGPTRVALVRDQEDERLADRAGIRITLRKPFERQEVLRVMREIESRGGS